MTKVTAPAPNETWDIITDGDDTLWECGVYYNASGQACCRLLDVGVPGHGHTDEALRRHCRSIQLSLIRKHGYYFELYEDAWVEVYLHLCHHHHLPVSTSFSERIYETASAVHQAPYTLFLGVIETMQSLRADGHRFHLLTLGDDGWQREKVRRNGLDGYFSSIHVIQRSKGPQMRLLAMNRPRVLMIGDSPHSDIVPAVRQGIPALLIHNTDGWAQSHHHVDPHRIHQLSTFVDLPGALLKIANPPPSS